MVKAKTANRHRQAALALVNGTVSIGLMALAARLSHQPLVFPSLGPTAFLLFYRPYAEASCPRNALIGHLIGALAGLGSLAAFGLLDQGPALTHLGAARIGAAATSLGLTAGAMIWVGTPHPPAGATTLIVSLGFLHTPAAVGVLMLGVVLLVAQGLVVNRWTGIDYPFWAPHPPLRPLPDAAGPRADNASSGGAPAMLHTVFVNATGEAPAGAAEFDRLRAVLDGQARELTCRSREWTCMFTVEAADIDQAAEIVRRRVADADAEAGLAKWNFDCWEVRETLMRLDGDPPPWHPHVHAPHLHAPRVHLHAPHLHLHAPHLHLHAPHLHLHAPHVHLRFPHSHLHQVEDRQPVNQGAPDG
jgi:hypothetical protein